MVFGLALAVALGLLVVWRCPTLAFLISNTPHRQAHFVQCMTVGMLEAVRMQCSRPSCDAIAAKEKQADVEDAQPISSTLYAESAAAARRPSASVNFTSSQSPMSCASSQIFFDVLPW